MDNETCATTFPDGLASASSFNDTLFEAIGRAIATEGRAVNNIVAAGQTNSEGPTDETLKAHTICWSPDINPFRHPLWVSRIATTMDALVRRLLLVAFVLSSELLPCLVDVAWLRQGRGQEVPSEDPLLCGKYGAAYIRGLQVVSVLRMSSLAARRIARLCRASA